MDFLTSWPAPMNVLPVALATCALAGAALGVFAAVVGRLPSRWWMVRLEAMGARPKAWIGVTALGSLGSVVGLGQAGKLGGPSAQAAALVTAMVLAALAWRMLDRRGAHVPGRLGAGATGLSLLVACGVVIGSTGRLDVRLGIWRNTAATGAVMSAWASVSDFDGDGYAGIFEGPDCEPFDASIHPGASDVSGNGVDEDCAGGDRVHAPVPAPPISGGAGLSGRSLILITVAGLTSDRTSAGGSDRMVTPGLDLLGTRAAVFPRAYVAATTTSPVQNGMSSSNLPTCNSFRSSNASTLPSS